MIKTNQFSAKTPYVTPWCKCAEIQPHKVILAGSIELQYSSLMGVAGEDLEDNEYNDAF